jgi:hypothetical protein
MARRRLLKPTVFVEICESSAYPASPTRSETLSACASAMLPITPEKILAALGKL